MFGRLLSFIALLSFASAARGAEPVVNASAGDVSMVIACDAGEQVDSIIAAWKISEQAGADTYTALSQPGTGIFSSEPACIVGNGIVKVSIVSVEPRGQVIMGGESYDTWRVGVERRYPDGSISFFLLWTSATFIRYGPDA